MDIKKRKKSMALYTEDGILATGALDISCPSCGAWEKMPCLSRSNKLVYIHKERRENAQGRE